MHSLPFSAVCLDMDGVLIQSLKVVEFAWTTVAREHGIALSTDCLREHVHGRPGQYTLDHVFSAYDPAQRQAIKRRVDALEETSDCELVPGVLDFIHRLQQLRSPLALVTSSWPARIAYVLKRHALQTVFDAIVSRDDIGHGKPAPDCYLEAANRLSVPVAACLVFEDSSSGVKAAVSAGAACIGIGENPDLLSHGAAFRCNDFRSLQVRTAAGKFECVEATVSSSDAK